jgi:hypothetical protein
MYRWAMGNGFKFRQFVFKRVEKFSKLAVWRIIIAKKL